MTESERRALFEACMVPPQSAQHQQHLRQLQQQYMHHEHRQQLMLQARRAMEPPPGQPAAAGPSMRPGGQQPNVPRMAIPQRLLRATAAPVLSPQNARAADLNHRPEPRLSPVARSAPKPVAPEGRQWEQWPVV
jgi:hypothetical protein